MTPTPASPTREELLDRWLDDMQVLAARLEQVHLPDDFPFDYTPASLPALEAALLEAGSDGDFHRAALPYLGEVLMDVCGGRWDIDPGTGGADGDPVVRPDPALGLPALSLTTLVDVALAEESGEVFAREYGELADTVTGLRRSRPGWQPVKEHSPLDPIGPQPVPPRLRHWLAERETAHREWARGTTGAEHAGEGGGWDFSPAGLDRLEREVRTRYRTLADFDADREGPFLQNAAWYLGQVVCLHRDSAWVYWEIDPQAPRGSHRHPDNPWSGIPFTHQPHRRQARPCDPLDTLRGLVRYGTGYHLSRIVGDIPV
ncbi:hypothetical protein [Streptomyces sp. NBC_00566]|uniref:hypothetical protein n=1 Tax=Streptomyces sp. NBC_00566 TaxID=2975778 RepID=UPI002E801138|nr:hypothetical protein [Streptomyces sp. NBC_00566]WUB90482.1 hypothetical protein OG812_29480 [Streptomyces sp. NBC_00566]